MTNTIELASSRLKVQYNLPGSDYRRTRFDWTGFITQVTLDHQHTFCVEESLKPGNGCGGVGLSNEFGIEQPVGFQEAQAGELFPKFGIGLLRKPDDAAYDFSRAYDIVHAFYSEVETSADSIKITVEPIECNGYAARLVKTIRAWNTTLEISYAFENVGQKIIDTHEYIHNFIGIDRQPISSNYLLEFPAAVQLEENASVGLEALSITGNRVQFKDTLPSLYLRPLTFLQTDQPQWTMQLQKEKVGLSETVSFVPMRIAVWGTFHVLSPEIFVGIHVEPGQTQQWKRTYHFFD